MTGHDVDTGNEHVTITGALPDDVGVGRAWPVEGGTITVVSGVQQECIAWLCDGLGCIDATKG